MRKKYIRYLIVFVILFQISALWFLQVHAEVNNATKQPAVCAWPSKTMLQYFQFQKDAINVVAWSSASNKTLTVSNGEGWLFTKGALTLPNSALDYLVDNMWWRTSSIISTTSTSIVLLLLASKSVIESDVEGFAILFKDRPIVRDYKQMLDIETEIFDTAFSFSKSIDLTRSLQWNTVKQLKSVIEKYQKLWLLSKWADPTWNISMANILSDLTSMNAAMKYFIAVWGEMWASELRKYEWCLWQFYNWECPSAVLKFDPEAIEKLKEEYSGVRAYWACNEYASNFKNTHSKAANNNAESIKSAMNDVKQSMNALKNALIWKGTWSKILTDPCQMTDYERALLEAYWWGTWTCWEWISVSSILSKVKSYSNNKKTLASQWEKSETLIKGSSSWKPPSSYDMVDELNKQKTTEDKDLVWYRSYWWDYKYNSEFSNDMNNELAVVFDDISEQWENSQRAAMASDLSFELTQIKWLVNQVEEAMSKAELLRKDLQDIADYQCSM